MHANNGMQCVYFLHQICANSSHPPKGRASVAKASKDNEKEKNPEPATKNKEPAAAEKTIPSEASTHPSIARARKEFPTTDRRHPDHPKYAGKAPRTGKCIHHTMHC